MAQPMVAGNHMKQQQNVSLAASQLPLTTRFGTDVGALGPWTVATGQLAAIRRRNSVLSMGCLGVLAVLAAAACSNSTTSGGAVDDLGASEVLDTSSILGDSATDDSVVVDVGAEVPTQPVDIVAPADTPVLSDGSDGASSDGGCTTAGCACSENPQCDSGFCVEVDAGKQCAKLCAQGCDTGMHCGQLATAGGDIVSVCVPQFPRICEPCQADSDCNNVLGGSENRCIPYKDGSGALVGAFCGSACDSDAACPGDYACKTTTSLGGISASQCVKKDLVCPCDARASKLQLLTACKSQDAAGSCSGKRSCGAQGLSVCDAPQASTETCNLIDDDCDGQTDEPTAGMCDDNLACTYDNCVAGDCQHPPKTGPCNDGNACTKEEFCSDGFCKGTAVVCDDKNPCTKDSCDPASGCTSAPDDLLPCSDNNACTAGDACAAGACAPGDVTVCDDQNLCTSDSCNPKQGCVFADNTLPCTDGDVCTLGDVCAGASCQPGKVTLCNDGNACTEDSCDKTNGCVFAANAASCSDGNVCTQGDQCVAGKCAPGAPYLCDDGNPCTTDLCDPVNGCMATASKIPCDDGDICTLGDVCAGDDCQPGKPVSCNDGNPCTDDGCDAKNGCQHAANSGFCSDGNLCTVSDACQGGACLGAQMLNCDDANACTDDSCSPIGGCLHTANSASCSDGSVCTGGDGCSNFACVAGPKIPCNDGNPCTDDSCDPNKGCVFTQNVAACDDGNACTFGDVCKTGVCTPGNACDANATCGKQGQVSACVCNLGFQGNGFACAAICGDKLVVATEACDDGNLLDADGCSGKCAIESGWACIGIPSVCSTLCGDGLKVGAEQCDDGNNVSTDACVNCKNASCGDGYVQAGVEQCDAGANNSDVKADACRTSCKKATCGDKVVDSGEQCDDGNVVAGDGCGATCQSESINCKAGVTLNKAPSGKAVVCQNPNSCEQDKNNDCPSGFHLCNLPEFNAYNDGWNYQAPGTVVGAISCRAGGGAGHLSIYGNLQNNMANNCDYGSSNPWCPSGYGCNEQSSIGVCCVDNPGCGDKVVNPTLEQCDDGNKVNGDGCDNDCKITTPPGC